MQKRGLIFVTDVKNVRRTSPPAFTASKGITALAATSENFPGKVSGGTRYCQGGSPENYNVQIE